MLPAGPRHPGGRRREDRALGQKIKFLRRVPVDPIIKSKEWGLRSYQDEPDSTSWGHENVYDVYTTATGKALDGTDYKDW